MIPFHKPAIGPREIAAAVEVLESGWLTTGPKAVAFEEAFAKRIGVKHALAVNSATAALHLALEGFGLRRDFTLSSAYEVTIPTLTFAACGAVVSHLGARPDLVDVGEDGLLGAEQLERHLVHGTTTPRIIMPVHFAGQQADVDGLRSVAPHARIIEDAAHAMPSPLKGDAAAYSFYATKTLTTGEGGMLVTDDDVLANRVSMMRHHGLSDDAWKRYGPGASWRYEVLEAGYKVNMPDLAAAIGLVQLDRADELRMKRTRISAHYDAALSEIEGIRLPPVQDAWHLYVIRVDPAMRDTVIERLQAVGIGTSVHFIPLHLQPYYQRRYGYWRGQFPVAERIFAESISLPIWPDMTMSQVEQVCAAVVTALRPKRQRAIA